MASISTKATVVALVEEVTEGTLLAPTLTTQYIAIQDDFSMAPATAVLDNAELKNTIGTAKPILGAEAPTASGSHYLRASGVVAQAPNYGLYLKSCLGAVTIAGAEYDTVASSTTSVIKVDTGEGASFQRGEALLIKDGVNGYRIRCIDSVSTDNLTIGFQVPTAPGTGVNLGKAVLYYPVNTGHPTFSAWEYIGNGGAIQAIAGCRVTEASFEISAGELINGSYSIEGVSFYFDPVILASADRYLDFTDDTGTFAAVVTARAYKDPYEVAEALQTAMATANPLQTPTVTYSDITGKYTIKTTGTVLSLLWNSGTNTANTIGDKIGFVVASDDTGTGATTGYTSDNAIVLSAPQVPAYDAADPLAAKDNEVMVGDTADYICFKASTANFTISTPKTNIQSVCEVSGISGSIINERQVTVSVTALLEKYDVQDWKRYRAGDNVKFQYSFGQKSGGNWIPGKCGALYLSTATISSFAVEDNDGLANVVLELTGYVNSNGDGEGFVNFL